MNNLKITLFAGAGMLTLGGCSSAVGETQKPNILFVLLDDLAYDAIQGSGRYPFLETPNINRLQREGMTFDNFFCTMSLSSPSRACFLTGTYPHIHGATQNDRRVDPNWGKYPPYTQILQKNGYQSAFIGKMHNAALWGEEQVRPGFDYWLSFRGQGVYYNPELNENGREFQKEGYITDILTDYTQRWLTEERDKSKPFSLCLWHKAVHGPFLPAVRHKGQFANDSLPLPPNGNGVETFEGKPQWQRDKKAFYKIWDKEPEWNPHFQEPIDILETLLAVDESLGRVLKTLEDIGELDNTIIIFSSDNGYFMGEHGFWDKRISYEECMKIPMIIRYPKRIKQGSRLESMCLNIDIAPTILEMAGVTIPEYIQGRSMTPLFSGRAENWRKSFLFEYYVDEEYPYAGPSQIAVRTDRYKLVDCQLDEDIDELYDIRNDPGEMRNLINNPDYAQVERELRQELERLKVETKYNPDRDFWLRQVAPKWKKKS